MSKSHDLRRRKFYHAIKEAEIADIHYPVQGVSILLPYGKQLLDQIANQLLRPFLDLEYQEVEFPSVIPDSYVSHLKQDGLFRVNNNFRSFFLSASNEVKAALVAKTLIKSYRSLPIKMRSRTRVWRENQPNALIKNIEFTLFEANGFFLSEEQAIEEWKLIDSLISLILDELEIPCFRLFQDEPWKSPAIIYTLLPFSGAFSSIFWSFVVGDRYIKMVDLKFRDLNNKLNQGVQLNTGFTDRILAAYLSNHQDEHGFIVSPKVAPQLVISRKQDLLPLGKNALREFRPRLVLGDKNQVHNLFMASGIPLMATAGLHQIEITDRQTGQSRWVEKIQFEYAMRERISQWSSRPKFNIPVVELHKIDKHGLDTPTLITSEHSQEELVHHYSLKRLGRDEQGLYYFAQKKY